MAMMASGVGAGALTSTKSVAFAASWAHSTALFDEMLGTLCGIESAEVEQLRVDLVNFRNELVGLSEEFNSKHLGSGDLRQEALIEFTLRLFRHVETFRDYLNYGAISAVISDAIVAENLLGQFDKYIDLFLKDVMELIPDIQPVFENYSVMKAELIAAEDVYDSYLGRLSEVEETFGLSSEERVSQKISILHAYAAEFQKNDSDIHKVMSKSVADEYHNAILDQAVDLIEDATIATSKTVETLADLDVVVQTYNSSLRQSGLIAMAMCRDSARDAHQHILEAFHSKRSSLLEAEDFKRSCMTSKYRIDGMPLPFCFIQKYGRDFDRSSDTDKQAMYSLLKEKLGWFDAGPRFDLPICRISAGVDDHVFEIIKKAFGKDELQQDLISELNSQIEVDMLPGTEPMMRVTTHVLGLRPQNGIGSNGVLEIPFNVCVTYDVCFSRSSGCYQILSNSFSVEAGSRDADLMQAMLDDTLTQEQTDALLSRPRREAYVRRVQYGQLSEDFALLHELKNFISDHLFIKAEHKAELLTSLEQLERIIIRWFESFRYDNNFESPEFRQLLLSIKKVISAFCLRKCLSEDMHKLVFDAYNAMQSTDLKVQENKKQEIVKVIKSRIEACQTHAELMALFRAYQEAKHIEIGGDEAHPPAPYKQPLKSLMCDRRDPGVFHGYTRYQDHYEGQTYGTSETDSLIIKAMKRRLWELDLRDADPKKVEDDAKPIGEDLASELRDFQRKPWYASTTFLATAPIVVGAAATLTVFTAGAPIIAAAAVAVASFVVKAAVIVGSAFAALNVCSFFSHVCWGGSKKTVPSKGATSKGVARGVARGVAPGMASVATPVCAAGGLSVSPHAAVVTASVVLPVGASAATPAAVGSCSDAPASAVRVDTGAGLGLG